jgi:hypothetical protein
MMRPDPRAVQVLYEESPGYGVELTDTIHRHQTVPLPPLPAPVSIGLVMGGSSASLRNQTSGRQALVARRTGLLVQRLRRFPVD